MNTLVLYPGLSPQLEQTKILGLPFLERFILTAQQSGFVHVLKLADSAPLPPQFVLVYPDFIATPSFLKQLLPSKDLKSPVSSKNLSSSNKNWTPFRSLDDLKSSEKWLLKSLVKEEEGFMSKHVERKISLTFTKWLIPTAITPNQMSSISIGIGIVGALFFMVGQKWYDISGSILFWLHSVLDGCDGEIARLKFLESRWGGILDFWGDNIVHSAVFLGIAWGLAQSRREVAPALLAFLAISGTLLTAGFVYQRTMKSKKSSGPLFTSVTGNSKKNTLKKIIDFLARRDFIYLVILLAIWGHVDLFLWMGAIGAPFYLLVLLIMDFKPGYCVKK